MSLIPSTTRVLHAGLVLPAGLFLWLAWICADDWNHDPNYTYGWLILPIAIYFLYRNFTTTSWEAAKVVNLSPWLLAPLPLLIGIIELIRLTPVFWRMIAWIVYGLGAITLLFLFFRQLGIKGVKAALFPAIFCALAVPWPTFIEVTIVREFSFWVAQIVGELLLLGGVFCQVQGKIIELTNGSVGVDEACSGLRSLQASLMVGLACGEWFLFSIRGRILLLILSIIGAFAINIFRAFTLSILVVSGGQSRFDEWHDEIGLIAMVGLTACIVGISLLISKKTGAEPPALTKIKHPFSLTLLQPWKPAFVITLAAVFCFLAAHSWFFFNQRNPSPGQPFLQTSHWNADVQRTAPPDAVLEILRADSGGYLVPPDAGMSEVVAYHFFWKPSRSNGKVFFHRPDVCMPGGGWTQNGTATLTHLTLNGRPTTVHQFNFSRGDLNTNLFWICWTDDRSVSFDGSTDSYLQTAFLKEFIQLGKRMFSVEIFAIMTTRNPQTVEDWNQLLGHLGDFEVQL